MDNFNSYPSGCSVDDLAINALLKSLSGHDLYFGAGSFSDSSTPTIADEFHDTYALQFMLETCMDSLGELAENPGKYESKTERLKTRNTQMPGKRINTVELKIVGVGNAQKSILESDNFQGAEITLVLVSRERSMAAVFNGLRWTVDITGEADKLFEATISTEFIGGTDGRIYVFSGIPTLTNLLTNGTFDSATGWTLGAHWAITGGQAVATSASGVSDALEQSLTLTNGVRYRYFVNVIARTGTGTPLIKIGGQAAGTLSTVGRKSSFSTPSSTDNKVSIYTASGTLNITLDDIVMIQQ